MAHLHTAPSRTLNADDVEQYLRDLKLAFIANTTANWPRKPPTSSGPISTIWAVSLKARPCYAKTEPLGGAFTWHAFRCSRRSTSFAGTGPHRLTKP